MGLSSQMFNEDGFGLFQCIVKYRNDNKVNEIIVANLSIPQATKSLILDWLTIVNTHEYGQYFKAFEKEYINKEQKKIMRQSTPTRAGCLGAATKLVNLAESGQIVEEDLNSAVDSTCALIEERQKDDYSNKFAFSSDFQTINSLGHYEAGTLVTLGGGSGHGKSTFALNMVLKWLENGLSVVYFSNEMEVKILLAKLVCIKTGIKWELLMNSRGNKLTAEGMAIAFEALESFRDEKLFLYTKDYSLPEMNLLIKTIKPDVFVLDTVNALIKGDERVDIALGDLARTMKSLAEEVGSLAVIVAQLKDTGGRPTDKNLVKESRQIRDASDYMDFIYREKEQRPWSKRAPLNNVFEIYRVKGRYTGIGRAFMNFEGENGRITDFNKEESDVITKYFNTHKKELFREE